MMTIDIMLDLETWGTDPGRDLRSIGATVFNRTTGVVGIPCPTCKGGTTRGNVNDGGDCSDCMNTRTDPRGEFYIAVDNPIVADMSLGRDGEKFYTHWDTTAQAWYKYPLTRDPKTVQWWNDQSAEAQAAFANPVDLMIGLMQFDNWLHHRCIAWDHATVCLWSHGPAFDPPILAAAYRAVQLPVPWHYRAPRDTRTILEAAGMDPHTSLRDFDTGIFHHALNDAQCQAAAVCAAFGRLRVSHDVVTHRDAWRRALMVALQSNADVGNDGVGYWEHEIDAFDRVFAGLANHPGLER